jgi:DNA-binding response OmpR family regulator
MDRILVVEDDIKQRRVLSRALAEEGIDVVEAATMEEARARFNPRSFDALIVDRMLPDGDGLALCSEVRRSGASAPILMLTARGELNDRVEGLREGADYYVVKPFEIEELLAVLTALIRRSRMGVMFLDGDLKIDFIAREASLAGKRIDLTDRELALLARLAADAGRPVSRSQLLESVWHLAFDPGSGVLEVHVSRLREKLGEDAWRVETVRRVGYRLRKQTHA